MDKPTKDLEKNKKSWAQIYILKIINFYFAPRLRSVFRIIYLIVFSYTALYYLDYLRLALKYIFFTLMHPTVFLTISHLFWGITFILTFIFPFSLSVYSIFLLFRIWEEKTEWVLQARWIITIAFIFCSITAIVLADDVARFVARQDELRSFIEANYLNGRI